MAKKQKVNNVDEMISNEQLISTNFTDEIEDGMLSYALKTIIDRALPDVRDGLKPVQRRILYASWKGGYLPSKGYVKNAKIVGATMGDFHPHGDGSIYSAETAMSQSWTFRYPLIDFQGNNGSVDGDGPAAMRYTEGKLDKKSLAMLEDIDKECVDFKSNYSETHMEPEVLPGLLPNILLNGASGIAVGYTTEIPSHNLCEVVDGIISVIKDENITVDQIMQHVKGPDLPGGAYLINNDKIKELYETGKSSLTYRAKYFLEENEENGNTQIVITEIPPDVKKPSLVEKIYSLCFDKKHIARVNDVRDESEGESIRIVVELHKTAVPELIIKELYSKTQLEKNLTYIMRCIVNQTPKVLSLKQIMEYYIEHRQDVVLKRTNYLLNKTLEKINIQKGYRLILNNIDKAIDIIKNSDDVKDASSKLNKEFGLNDSQITKILDLPLRSLTKLNRKDIDNLIKELENLQSEYENIVMDKKEINKVIIAELKKIKKDYGDERRTEIIEDIIDENNEITSQFSNEPVALLLTNKNNIKHMSISALEELEKNKLLKERTELFIQGIKTTMDSEFTLILSNGYFLKTTFSDLLKPIDLEKNVSILKIIPNDLEKYVYIMTQFGITKKIKIENLKGKNLKPVQFLELQDNDKIISVLVDDNSKDNIITILTNDGLLHRFYDRGLKESNVKGKGINCINLDDNLVIDFKISKECNDNNTKLIIYSLHGEEFSIKCSDISEFKPKGRMSKGVKCIDYYKKSIGNVYKILLLNNDSFILDNKGNVIDININDIKVSPKVSKPEMIDYNVLVDNFYI